LVVEGPQRVARAGQRITKLQPLEGRVDGVADDLTAPDRVKGGRHAVVNLRLRGCASAGRAAWIVACSQPGGRREVPVGQAADGFLDAGIERKLPQARPVVLSGCVLESLQDMGHDQLGVEQPVVGLKRTHVGDTYWARGTPGTP